MERLRNKVAIVTGGATGIGEAISKKFAREGAKVIVAGLPDDPVEDVVKAIKDSGGEAIVFHKDLSIAGNAELCVYSTVKKYGKLDILINNAGTLPEINEIDEYSEEAMNYLLINNLKTTMLMTKYAIPELKRTRGVIVSAGSESGKLGLAQGAPYGGTKGFIHAFTRGVAVEQAKYGIRANCVCPGAIDTAMTHKETSGMTSEMEKMIVAATPMGRRGTPEEIANVYLFLASDEASYMTGALVSVDGGITIGKGPVGKQAGKGVKTEPEGELALEHKYEGATDIRRG